ncbi:MULTISPECIES: peptidylprolyl isomerase [unclassified Okeania]|uniref:peptidylprolyl isomerase n=1 Tax=unclassified Okeania TaxID=2634635 RepID=UPI0013BB442A|nr:MULTISPECIES: peptidylprolyl isomerase [unclassified Okeania]NES77461.1 hypothetical protein [Okeania sp. SIO1H4]NET14232.1 hypothetical protein [Okeania sp. SIO1H6]NET20968.1 hypothetical protein [Okeania sp. SIO1H5]NET96763.1 hypothetical protein [Okeania sp. SIO1H2]
MEQIKSTEEYLEELELVDLEGQEVTVEMVVQKVSQEEEEEENENEEEENENEEERGEKEKITVTLNSAAAPVTAANFVDLVEQNFYDALAFHRFVDGFVVQGGDPQGRDENFLIEDLGSGKYINPATEAPREIPLEIQVAETGEIVYNEVVADPVELSHEAGVIAMARSEALDTASSQFYFTLDDVADQLDGGYAVFGEVSEGFDFVQEIREGDRILVARVVDGDISSRTSQIATNSDLLNDWVNADNEVKVSYVLSMDMDEDTENEDSNADSAQDDNIIEASTIDNDILSSQITQTVDEEVEGEEEGEEEEEEAEENSDSEDDNEGDEIASAVDEDEDSEEATEVAENDDSESILDIDVVDSSFTTIIGTESDDVIDVLEISDVDTDSSFAIMGLAGDDEISGGNGTDILSGNEGNDIVSGRDGQDFVRGGKGVDILIGGKGDDIIIGDHGADILTGGLGADSFILRADIVDGIDEIDQADLITDFNVADNDQIVVIANFIPSEGLTYELFDDDTVIRLSDSGFILGVVSDTSIEEVENNIVAVSADDYALRLG